MITKENYIEGKLYFATFDMQIGQRGLWDSRVIGLVEGKYGEMDCPSGKALCVTYADSLTGTIESCWVCNEDNVVLHEVSEDEYTMTKIMLSEEDE